MNFFRSNPLARFLISALLLYIAWHVVYELWIHPQQTFDQLLIDNLHYFSYAILQGLGFVMINFPDDSEIRTIGVDGTHGLWIGDPCNGATIFALFAGFIIAYPGKLLRKLVYIPVGIVLIHILNVFRIIGLCLVLLYAPDYLDLNHTYTFTIIIYSFVFLLWYLWSTRFSGLAVGSYLPITK